MFYVWHLNLLSEDVIHHSDKRMSVMNIQLFLENIAKLFSMMEVGIYKDNL